MKVLYIHNEYGAPSGEEHASGELVEILQQHGHEVRWFKRSSAEILHSFTGKIKAFFTGIANPSSARKLAELLDEYQPDIVQVQNLYPLISPSIFKPLRERHIPVVMRCPNYRLFCPCGLCLDPDGKVCELCFGQHEMNCIKKNCRGSLVQSITYAVRNRFAYRRIFNGVDVFITQSDFQKQKFIRQGIPAERIGILPGISPDVKPTATVDEGWVSFVGRVSAEKGIYEFIEAARMLPNRQFKVAGTIDPAFVMPDDCPKNLEFVGFKKGNDLNIFYEQSHIIVIPSKWYEGFPNVILRGMMLRRPVITTNIGAMQSIVDNEENGILIEPGNAQEIADGVEKLFNDSSLYNKIVDNGVVTATSSYSRENIYQSLINIYSQAKNNSEQRR